jgi:hypothetical protein
MSSLCDTNETFLSPKAQGARLVGGVTETESSCRGSKKKKKKKKKKEQVRRAPQRWLQKCGKLPA